MMWLKSRRAFGALVGTVFFVSGAFMPLQAVDLDQMFRPYQEILTDHLLEKDLEDNGLVTAFRYRDAVDDQDTMERLQTQREASSDFDPDVLDDKYQAIAFWLNAYNFFMLAHILENPKDGGSEWIESVRDYGSLFRPYRVFSREIFDVGGRQYSLSEIENDILLGDDFKRRGWKEARVHFAVNCASVGCPPLRDEIYTGANTDALMTENTERAMRTPRHMHIDGDTLRLSQLFEWYEEDYLEEAEDLRAWIGQFVSGETREAMAQTSRIRFIDYDWTLNAPRYFPEFE